jgi:mannose-6-phosphate isomerase class I
MSDAALRKTTQDLLPVQHTPPGPGRYDLYPAFPVRPGAITRGIAALAAWIAGQRVVVIDGFGGVRWHDLRQRLDAALARQHRRVAWLDVATAQWPEPAIDALIAPFLGGADPLFGTRFTGALRDFFDPGRLAALCPDPAADVTVLYGCGAALAGWDAPLAYVELPRNEVQFRARAGSITNLGASQPADPKAMYKRLYFVDWPALTRHKAELLPRLALLLDGQRPDDPAMIAGDDARDALTRMARHPVRARPWFEPGPWGGQWLKQHIPQLPQDVPNYAWSFELISPENGLIFGDGSTMLEVAFDLLMAHGARDVLGDFAGRFGVEFPIRFDFLDTIGGGNLSLQCHPRPEYIRQHFGEHFTQDETYYILAATSDAEVLLGFHDDIDPAALRDALERSLRDATPLDVDRFVQRHPARPHDLFLIPSGTVHCSGSGNLVLEISATPYIFTFKMYDWMRLDLEGRPRPLNIGRACENLAFERKGALVRDELISRPVELASGAGWRHIELPTHPEHFYRIERYEFDHTITVATNGSPHVLSLVAGAQVAIDVADGPRTLLNAIETLVVPAVVGRYQITNLADSPAWVIVASLKPEAAR